MVFRLLIQIWPGPTSAPKALPATNKLLKTNRISFQRSTRFCKRLHQTVKKVNRRDLCDLHITFRFTEINAIWNFTAVGRCVQWDVVFLLFFFLKFYYSRHCRDQRTSNKTPGPEKVFDFYVPLLILDRWGWYCIVC